MAHVIDSHGTHNMCIEASFNLKRAKNVGMVRQYNEKKRLGPLAGANIKLQKRV